MSRTAARTMGGIESPEQVRSLDGTVPPPGDMDKLQARITLCNPPSPALGVSPCHGLIAAPGRRHAVLGGRRGGLDHERPARGVGLGERKQVLHGYHLAPLEP